MLVKLVLDGGIKSCCSVTSTEVVRKGVASWLRPDDGLVVVDIQKEPWEPDDLARLAMSYFHEATYPLLYLDGTLATLGGIPHRIDLLSMIDGKIDYGIREEDIVNAARINGYLVEQENAAT